MCDVNVYGLLYHSKKRVYFESIGQNLFQGEMKNINIYAASVSTASIYLYRYILQSGASNALNFMNNARISKSEKYFLELKGKMALRVFMRQAWLF